MNVQIGVEISGSRYAQVLSLQAACTESLSLLPVQLNQGRAVIRIVLLRRGKIEILERVDVRLPAPARQIGNRIDVVGRYDGEYELSLSIMLNDAAYRSSTFDLSPYRAARVWPWVLVALLIVGSIFAVWGFASRSSTRSSAVPVANKRAAVTAAPSPEPTESNQASPASEAYRTPLPRVEKAASDVTSAPPVVIEVETSSWPGDVVYFEPESSRLTPDALGVLRRMLPELKRTSNVQISIEGHTALFGTLESQLSLSLERAIAVREMLYQIGWTPDLDPLVEGFGAGRLMAFDSDFFHLNRRVEIFQRN